jgi:hypothetical protein
MTQARFPDKDLTFPGIRHPRRVYLLELRSLAAFSAGLLRL